jgi:hypothetical protein
MDYKKKYENALPYIKDLIEHNVISTESAGKYFPELKENDDERTKRILNSISNKMSFHLRDIFTDEEFQCFDAWSNAWLEKQGEQKQETSYPKFDFDDILALQCCMETAEKVTEDKELYKKLQSLHSRLHDAYWLEKQGKQEEPQVEDGEKITYFETAGYKLVPKFKVKYAGREYNVLEVKDVSGVTFYGIEDEPNHIDYVKAENCERVDGYNIKENGSLYPTKPAVFSEHKPAWSEEDERQWNNIWDVLDGHFELSEEGYKNAANWFKAIKGRVQPQPKQEWSEEDEEILSEIIYFFEKGIPTVQHDFRIYVSWLKSLRPQSTWKPSDKQIKAVRLARSFVTDDFGENPTLSDVLVELEKQLKKLK